MQVAGRSTAAALVASVLLVPGCGAPDIEPGGVASGASSPYDAEERAIRREAVRWLEEHERATTRSARRPAVLSTRVTSIKSYQDNAAAAALERCVDQSDVGMARGGVPVPGVHDEPVLQRVVVVRYENRTWRIGSIDTTDRPCSR
jgi:hypothetical protein